MFFRFMNLICLLICLAPVLVVAQTASPSADVHQIVERMMAVQQENKAHLRTFTVKRDYQVLDKQMERKAQVVASVTVVPPGREQYKIESNSGGVIWQKILRDVLAKEGESPEDQRRTEISPENYDFRLTGEQLLEGRRCYLLALIPKVQDRDLVRGQIWVDTETYNIPRIEGDATKSPSWWVLDLHILMAYGEVDGMWVRKFTHAVANVRFKGRYVMESRALEYHSAGQTASGTQRDLKPGILAGSAVNP